MGTRLQIDDSTPKGQPNVLHHPTGRTILSALFPATGKPIEEKEVQNPPVEPFTQTELKQAINSVKPRKAPGPDHISHESGLPYQTRRDAGLLQRSPGEV